MIKPWLITIHHLDQRGDTGYTSGMKTAISLPDEVYQQAESFARRARKTRSQLYAEALAEYLARHTPDSITEMMNLVCDRIADHETSFPQTAARRVLSHETW